MKIELKPLEGIIVHGEKVALGADIKTIPSILGQADKIDNTYYYLESNIAVHTNDNSIEYIEFSFNDIFEVILNGINVFTTKKVIILEELKRQNENKIKEEENHHTYTFHDISVNIGCEITEKEAMEIINEAKAEGVYEDIQEEIENDIFMSKYISTIGLGVKDYCN